MPRLERHAGGKKRHIYREIDMRTLVGAETMLPTNKKT